MTLMVLLCGYASKWKCMAIYAWVNVSQLEKHGIGDEELSYSVPKTRMINLYKTLKQKYNGHFMWNRMCCSSTLNKYSLVPWTLFVEIIR